MAAVTICSDFGTQKIKSDTVSTVSPSISHEVMGPDAMSEASPTLWFQEKKVEILPDWNWVLKVKFDFPGQSRVEDEV